MKKLYLITYSLLITGGFLGAQNAPQKATSLNLNKGPTKPEALPKADLPAADSARQAKPEKQPAPAAVKEETLPVTAAVEKTAMPEQEKINMPVKEDALMTSAPSDAKEHSMITIGLTAETRQQVASLLHKLLANEYALYAKTQKYHWNVKGKFFGSLHALFQKQYEMLAEIVDQVAERSLALGIPAIGGLKELTSLASVAEETNQNIEDTAMITQLLTDHEMIIRHLRADIDTTVKLNDMGTNNFLSDLITKHEKIAWMLRAHLQ